MKLISRSFKNRSNLIDLILDENYFFQNIMIGTYY